MAKKTVNLHDTTYAIHKVEHDTKTTITFDFNGDGRNEENNKISSKGQPKTGFLHALQDLKAHAMFACDIPVQYSGGISVKSVTWKKKGVIFVLNKRLKTGGDATIKSPETELYRREAKDQKHSLPEECTESLNTLRMAAIDYIKGERGNGPMFDEQEESGLK